MRIGFFTDGFLPQPNGVATSVFETARELESRGHKVYIIAPKYPGYIDRSLTVIRLPSFKIAEKPETRIGISLPDRHLRKILSLDFDVIHGHSGGPITLLGWEIARAKKVPCVVTYHTLWNRYTHYFLKGRVVSPKMMEQATKIFGNQVDFLIAPTDRVQKELKSYGVKKPIRVIPSGINIEKFQDAESGFLKTKLSLRKDEKILLFVGRLGTEKSVDFIIRAFKKVFEEESDAHLVIVGDGPERKKLEELAKRLKVNSRTHFVGEIDSDKMHKIYPDAEVFVFSSTTETQGLVVPEALAAGVPVVAIDDPAYEIVKNSENGYLVKKDEREFANKILSILKNKNIRDRFSIQARMAAQKLSVKSTVNLLEAVYFDLIDLHNKQSVGRILTQKARGEAIFVTDIIFWLTVISARAFVYLYHSTFFYPRLALLNQSLYHSSLGLVLLLLFVALYIKKRKLGFGSLLLLGVGTALVADDLISMIFRHTVIFDYWNSANLLLILLIGLIPLFFTKEKNGDRPKFYITARALVHENPKNPKITVVIPAYNEGKFIEGTLKSMLNQTYKDFELIVVDNNSDDNTAEVAKSFGAKVVLQKIKGVAAARQKGFMAAQGEIIASTDADSIIPEDWVARIVAHYDKHKSTVAFGGLGLLYSGPVTARAAGRYLFPAFWKLDKMLSGGWNMSGFNMSVRRNAFSKSGGFNTELKMGEDVDLSEKMRLIGKVDVDMKLAVFVSGRRYAKGLLGGLMIYAPWWISKVILKRPHPFNFPAVRSEKRSSSSFDFLPLSVAILLLTLLFYLGNMEY